jgi:hypothetical protein
MASIAVFIALGGTSYAVATGSIDSRELKNNAVRSKDLRNNDVRSKDLRNGTIGTRDVGDGALLSEDFAAGQLPAGPKGDKGDPGQSAATNVTGRTSPLASCSTTGCIVTATAVCEAGEVATGGGGLISFQDEISESQPLGLTQPTGWRASATDDAGSATGASISAFAMCARP